MFLERNNLKEYLAPLVVETLTAALESRDLIDNIRQQIIELDSIVGDLKTYGLFAQLITCVFYHLDSSCPAADNVRDYLQKCKVRADYFYEEVSKLLDSYYAFHRAHATCFIGMRKPQVTPDAN